MREDGVKGEGVQRKDREVSEEARNRVHGCIGLLGYGWLVGSWLHHFLAG